MLSVFPSLLDWGFFAPTILRVAAGSVLLLLAYQHLVRDRAMAPQLLYEAWILGMLELLGGLSLVLGLFMQIGAILAIIVSLPLFVLKQRFAPFAAYHDSTYLLLIAIALALLVGGPGALAFDLPL